MGVSLSAAPYAQAGLLMKTPNNLGLVGYWSFEDGKGATVTDFSGKGNKGTMTNMDPVTDWVTGRVGKALDFDGADDYVAIGGSSSVYAMTTNLSVFAWIRTTDTSWEAFSGGEGDDGGWGLVSFTSIGGNGQLTPFIGGSWRTSGHTAINDGQWHHVGYTLSSASGGTLQFYLDGAPDGSAITSAGSHNGSGSGIRMGSDSLSQFELDGELDEARVYNRVLSSTEVAALYNVNTKSSVFARGSQIRLVTSGLGGFWSFNEADISGTTAYDRAGSANGTLTNGPTATAGKVGQALNFDGSNDYVTAANSITSNGASRTVAAWIYPNSVANSEFVSLENTLQSTGPLALFGIRSAKLSVYHGGDYRAATTALTTGRWYHVVYTYNSSGNAVKMYLNGNQDYSGTVADANSGSEVHIGVGYNGYFNGKIDEVRIYNRELSATEITQLYHGGRGGLSSSQAFVASENLVAWHTFDGPYLNTTTSTDRSASGNHGTLANGPTPKTGKVGQALRFDGSDDRVVTRQNPSGLGYGTGDFSWFAWIYPERVNDSYEMIWAQGGSGIPYLAVRDNILHFYLSTTYETSAGYITANTWQHVGIVRSAGTLTLYKNGVAYSSTSSQPGSISAPDYAYISSYGSGGAHAFKGAIDDLRIYNKALSSDEVLLLYRLTGGPSVSQAPPDTTAPVISSVVAGVGDPCGQAENISWTTNEASDTQIEYGTTSSYGSSSSLNSSMVTSHSATATGLNFNTTYYYRARSADAAGNIAYSTSSFSTPSALACGGGP